mgnify:CR=1 FL=1
MATNCRHNDPTTWCSRATDQRGYQVMCCPHCKDFKGYKPPNDQLQKQNRQQRINEESNDVPAFDTLAD